MRRRTNIGVAALAWRVGRRDAGTHELVEMFDTVSADGQVDTAIPPSLELNDVAKPGIVATTAAPLYKGAAVRESRAQKPVRNLLAAETPHQTFLAGWGYPEK